MKRFIFYAACAIFMASGLSILPNITNGQTLSPLQMANAEALSNIEGGICRLERIYDSYGGVVYVCVERGTGPSCTCGSVN